MERRGREAARVRVAGRERDRDGERQIGRGEGEKQGKGEWQVEREVRYNGISQKVMHYGTIEMSSIELEGGR